MTGTTAHASLEDIAALSLKILKAKDIVEFDDDRIDWPAYESATEVISCFEVPQSTISPAMRRLLFSLAYVTRPTVVVGAGTYVGFAFSWLLAGAAPHRSLLAAHALDIDPEASSIARRNLARLAIDFVSVEVADAVAWLTANTAPISLLFIDIDSPDRRKAGYLDVLRAAQSSLASGAIVLAHDPCVARFAADFHTYHEYIRASELFRDPVILPIDECGLSVTRFL